MVLGNDKVADSDLNGKEIESLVMEEREFEYRELSKQKAVLANFGQSTFWTAEQIPRVLNLSVLDQQNVAD